MQYLSEQKLESIEKYKGRKEITENQDYILYHIYLYQQHVADPVLFSYFLS